jgi:hypothetical protein
MMSIEPNEELTLKHLVSFLSEIHAKKVDLFIHQQGIDTTTPARQADPRAGSGDERPFLAPTFHRCTLSWKNHAQPVGVSPSPR